MTVDLSRYSDTFRRLSQEAVACAPEEWDQGRLIIAFDGRALHYRMECDSDATPAVLTQQLAELCAEIYLLMEMNGQRWLQCIIAFAKTLDDSWGFEVKFVYPKPGK